MKSPATQFDHSVRIVSLENLRAMAARISGTCHRFTVADRLPCPDSHVRTVRVYYSNPDEFGNECQTCAHYPAYAQHDGIAVVLDAMRYTGGRRDDESWQAFHELTDCPELWRDPTSGTWQTEYEALVQRFPQFKVTSSWDKDGCVQTWHVGTNDFTSFREASDFAGTLMKIASRGGQQGAAS